MSSARSGLSRRSGGRRERGAHSAAPLVAAHERRETSARGLRSAVAAGSAAATALARPVLLHAPVSEAARDRRRGAPATARVARGFAVVRSGGSTLADARARPLGAAAWVLLMLLGAGCFVPRDREALPQNECVRCHGDSAREGDAVTRAAPPTDTFGNTAVSYPGVGAHAEHLVASATHGVVACVECHRVPETSESTGHNDGVTQLVFGPLATRDGGLSPAWDLGTRQCTNSGCHGPVSGKWTRPRPSAEACGACHALPPPSPHPQYEACEVCHAEVVNAQGFVAPALHVDGTVQRNEASCSACHGATDAGAPPRSLDGGTSVTQVGVGAHQAHLSGGAFSRPVACEACHLVPSRVATASHPNGGAAEVLAAVGYERATGACATACHGARSPAWTTADAGLGCNSCHLAPPALPHPQVAACALCHPASANGQVARGSHVNGRVDVMQPTACNGCHGSAVNDAPPRDLSGSADPTRVGVGAHQAHLVGRGLARVVSCDECHEVPATVDAGTHLDGVTQVRFVGVARSNLANATYTNGACANACHDVAHLVGGPGGGQQVTPRWTTVDGSQRQCDSCHGAPPPLPHPARTDCGACHLNALPDGGFARPELHVNGRVEFALP